MRFADAIEALLLDGHRVFVEASPHPVLTIGMQETFERTGAEAVAVPDAAPRPGRPGQLVRALAQAFAAGVAVDWTALFPAAPAPRTVELPTYAFQRERYWLDGHGGRGRRPRRPRADRGAGTRCWAPRWSWPTAAAVCSPAGSRRVRHAWLADHVVAGAVLVPGAALVEWALRAADEVGRRRRGGTGARGPAGAARTGGAAVQVVVGRVRRRRAARGAGVLPARRGRRPATGWMRHADGVLAPRRPRPTTRPELTGAWPPAGAEPVRRDGLLRARRGGGYAYGPAFQGLRAAWRDGADVLAEVALPEAAGEHGGFGIHPALLDAALHPAAADRPLATGPDTGSATAGCGCRSPGTA